MLTPTARKRNLSALCMNVVLSSTDQRYLLVLLEKFFHHSDADREQTCQLIVRIGWLNVESKKVACRN
jgi:hypothetical protein